MKRLRDNEQEQGCNDIAARMRILSNLCLTIQLLHQIRNFLLDDMLTSEGFDKLIDAIECEGQAYIDENG